MIEWSVAEKTLPGQVYSGDCHFVRSDASGSLVAVIDGLGHGAEASQVTRHAIDILREAPGATLLSLVRECHEKLQGTRGVVMSLARFNETNRTLTWLGVGNVRGILLNRDARGLQSREVLLLRRGVIGDRLPRMRAAIVPILPGALLIFATDGIRDRFDDNLSRNGTPDQIAKRIVEQHWRQSDDGLVLVARYSHGNSQKNSG